MRTDLLDERNTWVTRGAKQRIKELHQELKSVSQLQTLDSLQTLGIPSMVGALENVRNMECFYEWKKNNQENIEALIQLLGGRIN